MQNTLTVTDLSIRPVQNKNPHSNILAYCCVTFNHALVLRSLSIKEGTHGIYVSLPAHCASFVTPQAAKEISNRILATYVINHCTEQYA